MNLEHILRTIGVVIADIHPSKDPIPNQLDVRLRQIDNTKLPLFSSGWIKGWYPVRRLDCTITFKTNEYNIINYISIADGDMNSDITVTIAIETSEDETSNTIFVNCWNASTVVRKLIYQSSCIEVINNEQLKFGE